MIEITLKIHDELVPAVFAILRAQNFPEDDGQTECNIITKLNLTTDQFVKAMDIVDSIAGKLHKAME